MTARTAGIRRPLAEYAVRMHAAAGPVHHVASPLGAWLLAALCGPAAQADPAAAAELGGRLGVDPAEAAAHAADLLDHPHPAVLAAAALWTRPAARSTALDAWHAALPAGVETGDIPPKPALDEWARRHTRGLIDEFPAVVDADTLLLLATALATKVSWEQPFDLAPAERLGAGSPWAGAVRQVLRTPESWLHRQFIAATADAGDVAVHTARSAEGLAVTSVCAAPDVPPTDVLRAAYAIADGEHEVARRSLYDLPLGDSGRWSIEERPTSTTEPSGREERCTAVLPAWSATSDHDLTRPELGIPAAARMAAAALGLDEFRYAARQAAMARYSRVGFEAAAVSAMAVATGMPSYRDGLLRTAALRFGHAYAVVAVAEQREYVSGRGTVLGPWHGLPVFSAWVAEIDEAG